MNIALVLQYLYPNVDPEESWKVISKHGEQSIVAWNLADPCPTTEYLTTVASSADFQAWNHARLSAAIDRDTGKGIDKAIHPLAGIEEQLGILRVQIGEILNAIGLAPTADFDRLNTIAVEKIQEAAAKKEAL